MISTHTCPKEIRFDVEWLGVHGDIHDIEFDDDGLGVSVYVMCQPGTPFSKIGIASDIGRRQFQIAQPIVSSVRCVRKFQARSIAKRVEMKAHYLLRRCHFQKEWFFANEPTAIAAVDEAIKMLWGTK